MAKIKVILDVDEEAIKSESGLDDLDDAIRQELSWLYDSGMMVESWEHIDGKI